MLDNRAQTPARILGNFRDVTWAPKRVCSTDPGLVFKGERIWRDKFVVTVLPGRYPGDLRYGDGLLSKSVAAELSIHEHTVGKWRRGFLKDRCDGLLNEARPGRPRPISDDQAAAHLRRLPPHGSIRSSAGSLNSPESRSSEVFTPPSGSSRPTSVPSSTYTTETRSPSNGPSPQTRFWPPSNASATRPSILYVANFRFT